MDEESRDDSRDMQESLQEVKRELAYKRLRLLQEEIKELKTQIQSYKEDGELIDLTKEEETVEDPDYEKVILYRHKPTGYYYNSGTGKFYTLVGHQDSQDKQSAPVADSNHEDDSHNEISEDRTQKLLESIAQVSDMASQQSGFVYDSASGLYYDVQTGMYYDQDSQLYYNSQFGAYFYYDAGEGQYKLHSLAEASGTENTVGPAAPPENHWDRCVRLIVKESNKLQPGCLFVVTKQGLQLGREVDTPYSIQIPELEVSKVHAEITFDGDEDLFFITDLGSRNGTFLNDNLLSESKKKSKPSPLSHGDRLKLGATVFMVHIHVGTETCDQCEPGQLQQAPMIDCGEHMYSSSKRSIAGQRKDELQRLKKKYGLQAKPVNQQKSSYVDRAALRRATVGSEVLKDAAPDSIPSSVTRPIDSSNKGRQMLEKLGWSTGQGLGKSNTGIVEPVNSEVRDSRAGLGSSYSGRSLDDSDSQSRAAKHQRMMKHYEQAESHFYALVRIGRGMPYARYTLGRPLFGAIFCFALNLYFSLADLAVTIRGHSNS